MISFKRMNLWERLLIRVSKSRRLKYEARLEAAIRELVEHPELPCKIDGEIIPDGFGPK